MTYPTRVAFSTVYLANYIYTCKHKSITPMALHNKPMPLASDYYIMTNGPS